MKNSKDICQLFAFNLNLKKLNILTKEKIIRFFPKRRDLLTKTYVEWVKELHFNKINPNLYYYKMDNNENYLFILKNKTSDYIKAFLEKKGLLKKETEFSPKDIYKKTTQIAKKKSECIDDAVVGWSDISLIQALSLYKNKLFRTKNYNVETSESIYNISEILKYIFDNKMQKVTFNISQFTDGWDDLVDNDYLKDDVDVYKLNIDEIYINNDIDAQKFIKRFPKLAEITQIKKV